jgi:protein gp37
MSDLFHEEVPTNFIEDVFRVMAEAAQHQFQVLTKRADRLRNFAVRRKVPENVWLGVSVESPSYCWRIERLQEVEARVRFLSIEPLLASLGQLDLRRIDWVIVGGESGPHARAMAPEWVREIREQCLKAQVPFFFKQWGGRWKHRTGRELDGRTWDEMPVGVPIPVSPTRRRRLRSTAR